MRTLLRILLVTGLTVLGSGVFGAPATAAAGGGGCHRVAETGPIEAAGTSVDLVDFCMTPSVLRVEPGDTVTFINRDPAMHNVIGSGLFVDELGPEESASFRFDDAGTYAYACTLHPGMVGAIAVGDGRRVAPATLPIGPIEVEPMPATPTTAPLETLPLGASSPIEPDGATLPLAPSALVLVVVAAAAYVAGRRRGAGLTTS